MLWLCLENGTMVIIEIWWNNDVDVGASRLKPGGCDQSQIVRVFAQVGLWPSEARQLGSEGAPRLVAGGSFGMGWQPRKTRGKSRATIVDLCKPGYFLHQTMETTQLHALIPCLCTEAWVQHPNWQASTRAKPWPQYGKVVSNSLEKSKDMEIPDANHHSSVKMLKYSVFLFLFDGFCLFLVTCLHSTQYRLEPGGSMVFRWVSHLPRWAWGFNMLANMVNSKTSWRVGFSIAYLHIFATFDYQRLPKGNWIRRPMGRSGWSRPLGWKELQLFLADGRNSLYAHSGDSG